MYRGPGSTLERPLLRLRRGAARVSDRQEPARWSHVPHRPRCRPGTLLGQHPAVPECGGRPHGGRRATDDLRRRESLGAADGYNTAGYAPGNVP